MTSILAKNDSQWQILIKDICKDVRYVGKKPQHESGHESNASRGEQHTGKGQGMRWLKKSST